MLQVGYFDAFSARFGRSLPQFMRLITPTGSFFPISFSDPLPPPRYPLSMRVSRPPRLSISPSLSLSL